MANAALHENAEEANGIQSWEHSRVGTVSPLEFGYTMALCDWSVSTEYDQISSLLRLDAKEGIEKGGRFLRKTSDCIFEKDFLEHSTDNTIGFLATRLANRSNSIQLSTLIDLYQSENVDSDLLPDIARLLGHSEPEIQKLAAITLGRCKDLPETIHDEVLLLAENGPPSVRRAAVSSLRPGYGNDDATLEFLTDLLRRSDAAMTATCVGTLMKYDVQSEDLTDALMKGLAKMVLTSGNNDLSSGIELLRRIHSDPADEIRQYFEDDPSALAILNELLQESHEPDTVTSSETK